MDHSTIDRENIAERYVTGRLAPETAAAFEEHYLECADCCLRVETAERMERGLHQLADRKVRSERERPAAVFRPRRPMQWGLAAAAALVLALLPLGWQRHDLENLRTELRTTRERLAQVERAGAEPAGAEHLPAEATGRLSALESELSQARQGLDQADQERRALADQLAEARRPRGDLPIVPLTSSRGGADPVQLPVLRLPKVPGLVALWVEPGDGGFTSYRAILKSDSGAVVLDASGIGLNDLGALLLTVHSTGLSPGRYRLEIRGLAAGGKAVPVDRFELRVVPPR